VIGSNGTTLTTTAANIFTLATDGTNTFLNPTRVWLAAFGDQ
jgi:hypothetical protein